MPDEKPPAKQIKRLGTLQGDGAGPSGSNTAKSKFSAKPINFARKKVETQAAEPQARAVQPKPDVASGSGGGGRGRGDAGHRDKKRPQRGGNARPRDIVAFGGGAYNHDVGTRRQVPYAPEAKGKGGSSTEGSRLVKAGVKREDGTIDFGEALKEESDEDDGWAVEEHDPIDYGQYYPTVLPWRGPGGTVPPNTLTLTSDQLYQVQQDDREAARKELDFFRDPALLEQYSKEKRMFMLQLPPMLPLKKPASVTTSAPPGGLGNGVDISGASTSRGPAAPELATVRDLSPGKIGRFLVLRSGKVKLQIGECLLDVDAGVPVLMRQEAACIDMQSKTCAMLGQVHQRLVVTPDFNFLMSGKHLPPMDQPFPCAPGGVVRPERSVKPQGQIIEDEDEVPKGRAAGKARRAVVIDDDSDMEDVPQQQQQQQQGEAMDVDEKKESVEIVPVAETKVKEQAISPRDPRIRRNRR